MSMVKILLLYIYIKTKNNLYIFILKYINNHKYLYIYIYIYYNVHIYIYICVYIYISLHIVCHLLHDHISVNRHKRHQKVLQCFKCNVRMIVSSLSTNRLISRCTTIYIYISKGLYYIYIYIYKCNMFFCNCHCHCSQQMVVPLRHASH